MLHYELQLFRGDGRIERALALECENHNAAIKAAVRQAHAYGRELRQGARVVRTFPRAF